MENIGDVVGNLFEYDELKMYFGEDYWVTDKICISQPTIKQIYYLHSPLC